MSGPPCHGGKYEEGAYFTLHYPALSAAPSMMNEPMNGALEAEGMKILVHRLHETDIFVYPYPFEKSGHSETSACL